MSILAQFYLFGIVFLAFMVPAIGLVVAGGIRKRQSHRKNSQILTQTPSHVDPEVEDEVLAAVDHQFPDYVDALVQDIDRITTRSEMSQPSSVAASAKMNSPRMRHLRARKVAASQPPITMTAFKLLMEQYREEKYREAAARRPARGVSNDRLLAATKMRLQLKKKLAKQKLAQFPMRDVKPESVN